MDKQLLESIRVYEEPFSSAKLVKNLHSQCVSHCDRVCCVPESHFRGQLFSTAFAFFGIFPPFFLPLVPFQVLLQPFSRVRPTNDIPAVYYPHREKNLFLIIPLHLVL